MEGEAATDSHLPTSPSSLSSLSSSDLDTESTGSFFPDRSTSLGMLMDVSFPELAAHRRDRPRPPPTPTPPSAVSRRRHAARGRRWWQLCREEDMARRTSLGDFLRVERRLPAAAYYGGPAPPEHEAVGGAPLFADGKVLPPVASAPRSARLPVLLAGICSGGEG